MSDFLFLPYPDGILQMGKKEKYKDSVIAITNFCRILNRKIGTYRMHYLTEDYYITVELDNGTLKIPLHPAADFDTATTSHTSHLILNAASSFKPKDLQNKLYRKILEDWRKLFSDKRKS